MATRKAYQKRLKTKRRRLQAARRKVIIQATRAKQVRPTVAVEHLTDERMDEGNVTWNVD